MRKGLNNYLRSGYKDVSGWLEEEDIKIIKKIADIQNTCNLQGSVGEIGIHHGKLFILLHLLTQPQERSVAWDLFENQAENIDHSGRGDKEIFISNLKRYNCDLEKIIIIEDNSLNLNEEKILKELGEKARLFSIDGGHTAGITYHDLKNVAGVICQGGIIVVDDYFNSLYPGVSEGVMRYIIDYPQQLYPVVTGFNKFYFTNDRDYAQKYISLLADSKLAHYKFAKFADSKVLIFKFRRTFLQIFKSKVESKIDRIRKKFYHHNKT